MAINQQRRRPIGGIKNKEILIISEDKESFILYFKNFLQKIGYEKTGERSEENKIEHFFKGQLTRSFGGRFIVEITLSHAGITHSEGMVKIANQESLKRKKSSEEFRAFCVFDAENEEKLKKDLEIKAEQNVKKIISFPCYEAWLLMHFVTNLDEDKFQKIKAADLITELSNQYLLKFGKEGLQFGTLVNYYKNRMPEQIFKWFYANLNTAKANAQRLRKENKKHLSTEIDLLINELENFSVA
jgi:hypothetical protein